MIRELPLYDGAKQCVRSGYCCKQAPCTFGTWDSEQTQCKHLVGDRPGAYVCGIADEIIEMPGWEASPAFGAGCSSPLNTDRRVLIDARKKG